VSYLRRVLGDAGEDLLKELIRIVVQACRYARDAMGKTVMVCVALDAYSEDEEDRRYHLPAKKAFEDERLPVYAALGASIKALFNLYRYSAQRRYPWSVTVGARHQSSSLLLRTSELQISRVTTTLTPFVYQLLEPVLSHKKGADNAGEIYKPAFMFPDDVSDGRPGSRWTLRWFDTDRPWCYNSFLCTGVRRFTLLLK